MLCLLGSMTLALVLVLRPVVRVLVEVVVRALMRYPKPDSCVGITVCSEVEVDGVCAASVGGSLPMVVVVESGCGFGMGGASSSISDALKLSSAE